MGIIRTRHIPTSGGSQQRSRRYLTIDKFRGVDYSVSKIDVDVHRATALTNKININGVNHKRNGWKQVFDFGAKINGLWTFSLDSKQITICYAGTNFYMFDDAENVWKGINNSSLAENKVNESLLRDSKTSMYVKKNRAYFIGCGDFLVFGKWQSDGEYELRRVYNDNDTYIPTTTAQIGRIGGSVNTSRYTRDDPNLLTGYRKNTLVGEHNQDGDSVYTLDHTAEVSEEKKAWLEVKNVPVTGRNYNGTYEGKYFGTTPVNISTNDNVENTDIGVRFNADVSAIDDYVSEQEVYPKASDCWDAEDNYAPVESNEKWAVKLTSEENGENNYAGMKWEREVTIGEPELTNKMLSRTKGAESREESIIRSSTYSVEDTDDDTETDSKTATLTADYTTGDDRINISEFLATYSLPDIFSQATPKLMLFAGNGESSDAEIFSGAIEVSEQTIAGISEALGHFNYGTNQNIRPGNVYVYVDEIENDTVYMFAKCSLNGSDVLCSKLLKINLESGVVTANVEWDKSLVIETIVETTTKQKTVTATLTKEISRVVPYAIRTETEAVTEHKWILRNVECVEGKISKGNPAAEKVFKLHEYGYEDKTIEKTNNYTVATTKDFVLDTYNHVKTTINVRHSSEDEPVRSISFMENDPEPELDLNSLTESDFNGVEAVISGYIEDDADTTAEATENHYEFDGYSIYENTLSFGLPSAFASAVVSTELDSDVCSYDNELYFLEEVGEGVYSLPFSINADVYKFIPYDNDGVTDYYVTLTGKTLTIKNTVNLEASTTSANITITFYADTPVSDNITKAKYSTLYGVDGASDMLFLASSDNDSVKNVVYYSDIDNFTYFSDRQTRSYGTESTGVIAFVRGTDGSLIVHKEHSQYEPSVYKTFGSFINGFYDKEETEPYSLASFSANGSVAPTGCIAPYSVFGLANDSLFLSKIGVCSVALGDVTSSQRFIRERSVPVNKRLLACSSLEDATAITFDNRYYLAVDGKVFIADARFVRTPDEAMNDTAYYEWYVWENFDVSIWFVRDGELWFGSKDGKICKMDSTTYYDEQCIWFGEDYENNHSFANSRVSYVLNTNNGEFTISQDLDVSRGDILIDRTGTEFPIISSENGNISVENQSEVDTTGSIKIVRRSTVKDEFTTAILCPYSNVYEKMIHSITVTLYGDANNGVNVRWAYSRGEAEIVKDKVGFSDQSDNFDFNDFGFIEVSESSMRQLSFSKKVSMPRMNYVVLSFTSDKPYDSAVNSVSIEYSITGAIRGSK